MALTVTTINVNGIRAAARKGFLTWLEDRRPDVVTIQEVRAPEGTLAQLVGGSWQVADVICDKPGRAGVAIMSSAPQVEVREGLDDPASGSTGRWVEVDIDTADGRGLTVVSAYCHTGEATDAARMGEKHAYLGGALGRLVELESQGRHVLWTGDLNVARTEWDIKNWKGNLKAAGFLPEERAHLDRLCGELGWVDVVRTLAGDGPGPYTWWTYRGQAYDNDAGWRIDHQFATPELAAMAEGLDIDRSMAYADRWSDHAPVTVTFDLDLAG